MKKPDFIQMGKPTVALTEEQKKIRADYIRWYKQDHVNRLRTEVMSLLGGCCAKCGFSDIRALQIDHVHGGGSKEYQKLCRYTFLKKVLESIERGEKIYQCLCANCNWIKRTESNEIRRQYAA